MQPSGAVTNNEYMNKIDEIIELSNVYGWHLDFSSENQVNVFNCIGGFMSIFINKKSPNMTIMKRSKPSDRLLTIGRVRSHTMYNLELILSDW